MHPRVMELQEESAKSLADERAAVPVPELYIPPEPMAPPSPDNDKGDTEKDIELTGSDDFLPYLADINSRYDLNQQAWQDQVEGTQREVGDVDNRFLKPNMVTVRGIDIATGERALSRGDFDNEDAASNYYRGADLIRKSVLNVNNGYDINGVQGAAHIAQGVIAEGKDRSEFNRAVDMLNLPPWQANAAWQAAIANAEARDIEEGLTEPYTDEEVDALPPEPPTDLSREELMGESEWAAATEAMYHAENGEPFAGTPEELMEWYVDEMTNFNWKIGHMPGVNSSSMAHYAYRSVTQGEEYAKNFLTMMDYYDRLNTDWSLAGDALTDVFADPTTYIGFGAGFLGAKVAARVAQNRLRQGILSYIAGGATAGMVEGAVYGTADSLGRQTVAIQAGEQEGYDPTTTAVAGLSGLAGGAVIGGAAGAALSPQAMAMYRRGARQLRTNARAPRALTPITRQGGYIGPKPDKPMATAANLENATEIANSGQFKTNRDLKLALQGMTHAAAKRAGLNMAATDNPAVDDALVDMMTQDTMQAMISNSNAVGWYDQTVGAAMSVLETMHPEIGSDEGARFAFTVALANTSNGLKVDKNFELAEKAYTHYKATGMFPENIGIGTAAPAINDTFKAFNQLVESGGLDAAAALFDDTFTVKQLKYLGFDVSGELMDTTVRGAALMGPKIGNGFYSNLRGKFDQLTMDRWYVRTWGRLTGTLVTSRPDMVKTKTADLQGLVAKIKKDKKAVEAWKGIGVNVNERSMRKLALQIAKSSMDPANRDVMNASGAGLEMRKTGNSLAGYLDGQKEDPANGAERSRMRAITQRVLENVRQEHPSITMSDLQAVLWYAEKRLYEGAKSKGDDISGYADDEAPDYANAAAALARSKGISDEVIKKADANGRTAGAGRRTGPDGGEGNDPGPQEAGRSAQSKRRNFLADEVYGANRPRGRSDARARSFKRTGRASDRSVRGIAQVYEPKANYSGLLAATEVASPTFHELVPERAPDFHKTISRMKESSEYGAAVYVYPLEDYANMRLFMTENGDGGFAIKEDGDIVSVFSGGGGSVYSMLRLAVEEGGTKLDCFNTALPSIYKRAGFVEVDRYSWDDQYMPPDWDKEVFKEFNGGEPDVVMMEYRDE